MHLLWHTSKLFNESSSFKPYEMNLQLTALVSRLAMLPHPHLHEFLLNPLVPIVPGTTTLYSTLQEVARELQAALASFPNSKKMLVKTRQELLGDVSHQHDFPEYVIVLLNLIYYLSLKKNLNFVFFLLQGKWLFI